MGTLARCRSLPRLGELTIWARCDDGDEGMALLADGLRRGMLPSLQILQLTDAQIGPQGATALAPSLAKRALPSLKFLGIDINPLGDAGLAALLPALRQLPTLERLYLTAIQIGDEGVASLVAQPNDGAFEELEEVDLRGNRITYTGCATLASALHGGAMPALNRIKLHDNPTFMLNGSPASDEALEAVFAARPGLVHAGDEEGYEYDEEGEEGKEGEA